MNSLIDLFGYIGIIVFFFGTIGFLIQDVIDNYWYVDEEME